MTIKQHMQGVEAVLATLPPDADLTLVSLEDKMRGVVGGRFVEVSRQVAARLIKDGSHRLPTDEEAQGFHAEQCQQREAARAVRMMPPAVVLLGRRVVLPARAEEQGKKRPR
jgi:hypothetical protein